MLRILRITFALTLASLAFAMPLSAADVCVASCGHAATRGVDVSVPSPAPAGGSTRVPAALRSMTIGSGGTTTHKSSAAYVPTHPVGAGRSRPLRI